LFELSLRDARYSHIAVIPPVSACVVYFGRKRIFGNCQRSLAVGAPLVVLGIVIYSVVAARSVIRNGDLSLMMLAIVLAGTGAFVICYGTEAFRAGMFAFGLLLFVIPLPAALLDGINSILQKGSADVSYAVLKLAGVPVLKDGVRVSLPGLEIEVAQECSGIRSAFALLITGLLAGYALLRTVWGRVCLGLLMIPIAILKNGVRIATISWLAAYVDASFMHSDLHRRGGLPFTLLAVPFLIAAIFTVRKWELRAGRGKVAEAR
jgi:exosortase